MDVGGARLGQLPHDQGRIECGFGLLKGSQPLPAGLPGRVLRKKEEIEHTPLVDVAPRRRYLERFPDLRRNRSPHLPGKFFFPVGQCVFQLDLISLQLLFQDRSLLSDRFPSREVFGFPELEHRVQLALVFCSTETSPPSSSMLLKKA